MQNLTANIQTPGQNPKTVLKDSPLPYPSGSPLGKQTNYFSKPDTQQVTKDILKIKHAFKKAKIERLRKIGEKHKRVSCCGTKHLVKNVKTIEAVKGEKGSIYYRGMMRCGCVWFCPNCLYKLMKARADELYNQLKAYKDAGKTVLFVTHTVQHHKGQHLRDLHGLLVGAFNFANGHRTWVNEKKKHPAEFLRTLEVLFGDNGWHPHLHCVFVGGPEIINSVNVFTRLYKKYLTDRGLLVNDHTVFVDKWNGRIDDMTEYMFKGMLEEELTGGGLKKSGKGKSFFELIDENNKAADEYIDVMKGKRQYHHSKKFFKDVRIKTDQEALKDDKITEVLFTIPVAIYADIKSKGIALHLLNEFDYGGKERAIKLLELYDCETSFLTG